MTTAFEISAHNGLRMREVAGVLMAIAGVLLVLATLTPMGRRGGQSLAGLALAVGGVLWAVSLHWQD